MNVPANTSLGSAPAVSDVRDEAKVSHRAITWSVLVALALTSLGLRLYCLDCYGFWGDEVASLEGARLGPNTIFGDRFGWLHLQTSGHYFLLWLTTLIADPATTGFFVRLPSALAGAATPLVVYGLGSEMFGRRAGLVAALMAVLAPAGLNYSQDLRPYELLMLLTVMQIYCLLRADRTGEWKWWVGFAAATIAGMLTAYVALTLALPALVPYLLWILWRARPGTGREKRSLLAAGASVLAVDIVGVITFLDSMQVTRVAPDLSRFSPADLILFVRDLLNWFAQTGVDAGWERLFQVMLLLFTLAGVIGGVRNGKRSAVALCMLFMIVPAGILAVLSTTNAVFQRYALFAMPFYFLLSANGADFVAKRVDQVIRYRSQTLSRWVTASVLMLATLPSLVGAINFSTPEGHSKIAYRPDFRSASSYLAAHTQKDDLIVFVDYPALGYVISDFYLQKAELSARMYDARDPRLGKQRRTGNLYFVVSAEDRKVLSEIEGKSSWAQVNRFDGVIILSDESAEDVMSSLERLVTALETSGFLRQPTKTLRGTILQSKGQSVEAASQYREAGTYFPFGSETLLAADGFKALGDNKRAWREAILSKFWQPQRPEVHAWLARKLHEEGYTDEARIEEEIERGLMQGK